MSRPLTWFGDDFTGSADVLLQYARAGLSGLLFLRTPTPDELAEAAATHRTVGIAGVTRALHPEQIAPVVEEAFALLESIDPRVVQYKICSTADSSPEFGNIKPAVDAGRRRFGSGPVGILVAQPDLGRYTVFANHFGRDANGIHRLDRVNAMANHAVTPMHEADLRLHFAEQLGTNVGGVPITELRAGRGADAISLLAATGVNAFVLDSLETTDLESAAAALLTTSPSKLFTVGSGGLATGLAAALGETGAGWAGHNLTGPAPARCLVVSGSASRRTTEQIDEAVANGWTAIALDPTDVTPDAIDRVATAAAAAFESTPGVIVYTAHQRLLRATGPVDSASVGHALAAVIRDVKRHVDVPRIFVAGGDTSGFVLTGLKAATLTAIGTVGTDLLLGSVTSDDPDLGSFEVVLKGGQLGALDVFQEALEVGTTPIGAHV
ncbi:four-carbon acid sugar kinase family protein [Curtobacterium sp. MCPF17_018]|uniref:four-carbon acid sugar kinase family protein n=1 Tax=Curtobacterium sp. MCPF17_018 TaxID=2175638 RepID=UPI0015E898BF|nr:four-carbon acid sugar kinase family protein [Curtobacterium sp. MCPF17_018]